MAKTVLLVEDDFYISELYQLALEKKGYTVLTATDGTEAIEIFTSQKPDAVLLDIMLPTVSGFAVLKHIREIAQTAEQIPVIIITNLESDEAKEEAEELGANAYWVKSAKTPTQAAEEINHYIIND